jgi:hypothetical protein
VRKDLTEWFGAVVMEWRALRAYRVRWAAGAVALGSATAGKG